MSARPGEADVQLVASSYRVPLIERRVSSPPLQVIRDGGQNKVRRETGKE